MIKNYTASADNTIVNAFKTNLQTRGTGSNTGQADVLEVFSVYGRQTTSSQELARTLIQFPIDQITNDRTAGRIPASGSVNFFLNLYNAETSKTVPRNMILVANPLFNSWQEGIGLDLENYSDETKGNEGSNWMVRANTPGVAEKTKFTFTSDTKTEYGAGSGANYIKLYNGTTRYNIWFNDGTGDSAPVADGTEVQVNLAAGSDDTAAEFAEKFKLAVDGESDFSATRDGAAVTVTATALGPTLNAEKVGTISPITIEVTQNGTKETPWNSVSGGGDFLSSSADFRFQQTFETGLENFTVDITPLVERWIKGAGNGSPPGIANYGIGVKLTSSQEAFGVAQLVQASSDKPTQNIRDGATTSFYTKRFFSRGTQYFFKRPLIQAKWDSRRFDHRGQFFISSSLAKSENINDLFFYNYVRGRLRSINSSDSVTVSIYSSSAGKPTGATLKIKNINNNLQYAVSANEVSTGVYKARLQVTSSLTNLHDVWSLGSQQIFTGSIEAVPMGSATHPREPVFFTNITNLQNSYAPLQTARFNLYVREKNWNPTIYTKAIASAPTLTIATASYRVIRTFDDLEVVGHDTGSGLLSTGLSFDVSGNYFDFDMRLLEPGYEYAFKLAFYDDELNSWQEQKREFKFRVSDYEY
tara:strand:- start:429 stop:2357 length:1929 start_codon:yes stop_codon:yes gene_type:complete